MILARYLVREFLKINSFIVIFFLLMYSVIDFLEKNTRYFPKYGATGRVILEYYLTQLPKMVVDLMPFSVLFSSIIVLWMFARSGEIAATRAAGASLFKICRPLLVTGLVYSGLSFLIAEFVVPRTMLHLRKIETVKIEKQTLDRIFLDSNWVASEGAILHFRRLNRVQHSLEEPEYFVFRNPSALQEIVYAERARFDAGKGVWIMENAMVTKFGEEGREILTKATPTYETTVNSQPPRLLAEGITSDQVGFFDLAELIQESEKAGGSISQRQVDLLQKVSLPFANVLFVFLAMPFALRRERQADTYIGIVVCLAISIIFWVGNMSLRSLAQNGVINPVVAAWSSTLCLALLCFLVVNKLDRGQ